MLYNLILHILPNNHNDLSLPKLKNSKLQMEETENNAEATLDEEAELLNEPTEEIKNDRSYIRGSTKSNIKFKLLMKMMAITNNILFIPYMKRKQIKLRQPY